MNINTDALNLQSVLFVVGILLQILGVVMLIPGAVDAMDNNPDWLVFVQSAMATFFFGSILALSFRGVDRHLTQRSGYLITVLSWLAVCAFGALPLWFSSLNLSLTNAFFETMSGLTTTGATVLSGLDAMAPGLLLWRSLLHWIGGAGIVLTAIIMLPMLRIGGMQLFRTESSDISDKAMPKVYQIAIVTVIVYLALTMLCTAALYIAGMTGFDAVNHAMATVATGGFSTKDASIGYFKSLPIELVIVFFMVAGSLPLVFYARLALQWKHAPAMDPQIKVFLIIWVTLISILTFWQVLANKAPFLTALRQSTFNLTSILTDTGFSTTDYSAWGSFAQGIFFISLLIGGCAGSTAGAVKIFRWQILFGSMRLQLLRMLSQHRVLVLHYGLRIVDSEMTSSVRNFLFMYISTLAVMSVLLMATGLDPLSSASSVAMAMAGAGIGLGPIVGPVGNFEPLTDAAKWILILSMLLGRLELSSIYVLLLRDFWRH